MQYLRFAVCLSLIISALLLVGCNDNETSNDPSIVPQPLKEAASSAPLIKFKENPTTDAEDIKVISHSSIIKTAHSPITVIATNEKKEVNYQQMRYQVNKSIERDPVSYLVDDNWVKVQFENKGKPLYLEFYRSFCFGINTHQTTFTLASSVTTPVVKELDLHGNVNDVYQLSVNNNKETRVDDCRDSEKRIYYKVYLDSDHKKPVGLLAVSSFDLGYRVQISDMATSREPDAAEVIISPDAKKFKCQGYITVSSGNEHYIDASPSPKFDTPGWMYELIPVGSSNTKIAHTVSQIFNNIDDYYAHYSSDRDFLWEIGYCTHNKLYMNYQVDYVNYLSHEKPHITALCSYSSNIGSPRVTNNCLNTPALAKQQLKKITKFRVGGNDFTENKIEKPVTIKIGITY